MLFDAEALSFRSDPRMPSQFALTVKMLTSTGTERKGGEIKTKRDGLSESASRQHSLDAMAKRVPTRNNDTCRKDWKIICTQNIRAVAFRMPPFWHRYPGNAPCVTKARSGVQNSLPFFFRNRTLRTHCHNLV